MRKVYVVLIGIITLIFVSATAMADEELFQGFRIVNVIVNGNLLHTDVPAINFHGRTLLPLRAVAELADMDVQWDPNSNTATLTRQFHEDRTAELESELASAKNDATIANTLLAAAKKDAKTAETELAAAKRDLAAAQAEIQRLTANPSVAVKPDPAFVVQPTPPALKTAKEIESYLQTNYGTIDTAAGPLKLEYTIWGPNDFNWIPYDYSVEMDWKPFSFFTDLETRISITPAMKTATIAKLKDHAKLVYDLVSQTLPGKKLKGGYYTGWYRYPTIKEGYEARKYLSWQNYGGNTVVSNYADAKLSSFWFNPLIDSMKY